MLFLYKIPIIKGISAFGTEFRRMGHVFRLPATFVTAVLREARRFLHTALCTEFAFVYGTAGTIPALCRDLPWGTALCAELPLVACTAATAGPAVC